MPVLLHLPLGASIIWTTASQWLGLGVAATLLCMYLDIVWKNIMALRKCFTHPCHASRKPQHLILSLPLILQLGFDTHLHSYTSRVRLAGIRNWGGFAHNPSSSKIGSVGYIPCHGFIRSRQTAGANAVHGYLRHYTAQYCKRHNAWSATTPSHGVGGKTTLGLDPRQLLTGTSIL